MVDVVETKLRVPQPRRDVVARPRLAELVAQGQRVRLTVVAAPAGFGKTTAVALALAALAGPPRVAWVSLDERDRDAESFWTYLLTAVERAAPGCGSAALGQHQGGVAIEGVLTTLVNELSVRADELTIVLDDYHSCDGPGVRPGMTFLLDHLPPQAHLVICTRADPVLPLGRLRVSGELIEIRQDDLRFTSTEAASFLNRVHGLALSEPELGTLERRTEGWVAALQLAALSLHGSSDPMGFIESFAGDDRFVVDYLVDEVLDRQPDATRRFLLLTSGLERLTGELCDAVTGSTGGTEMLDALARQNLFLIPLDDRRRWFRYHHLFAGALAVRLAAEHPGEVAPTHRRASGWLAASGDIEGAVRHALAAGDIDRAAELIEDAALDLRRERRESVIRRLVQDLPADVLAGRPILAVNLVGALMAGNEFDGVEPRLAAVEAQLAEPASMPWPGDPALLARLPAEIATYRAALALIGGDLDGAVAHANRAMGLTRPDDLLTMAAASALAGLAVWRRANLAGARAGYEFAEDRLRRAGHLSDALGCRLVLGDLALAEGRLGDARDTFATGLELAAAASGGPVRGVADMQVGLARVALEQGDHAAALEQLGYADRLGEAAGLPQHPHRWRVVLAELRADQGDHTAALSLLEEAEQVYLGDFSPATRPIAALRARLMIADGNLAGASEWARRAGVTATDPPDYLHEYEQLVLAILLLSGSDATERATALDLLERLLAAAETGGRGAAVVELLVLRAWALRLTGDTTHAVDTLMRAVRLAEPEAAIAVFVRVGPGLAPLLNTVARRNSGWPFALRLRDAVLDRAARQRDRAAAAVAAVVGESSDPTGLLEPLTERESDVLRLLRSDLDGPAIARALHVSLSTVRTHTQRIYIKLGVNDRRGAVRRAHHLGLFHSTR